MSTLLFSGLFASWWFRLKTLIRYYRKAQTLYQVHSPFVFRFCVDVLEDDRHYYAFTDIEWMRSGLQQSKEKISPSPFGAGGKKKAEAVNVSQVARTTSVPARFGELLFRLVRTYQPATILELGTSLGISALYLAKGKKNARVFTLEGHKEAAQIASQVLQNANADNVQVLLGSFDESLAWLFQKESRFELVFLDGDHNRESTLQYFEQLLPHLPDSGIFMLDDINWSPGMRQAWEAIKEHERVTCSIELYRMGIVFLNPDIKGKQDFTLIPVRYKPWRRYIL